ncbi:MAG: hypothetical protein PHE51_12670 [Eubacteriales bacterium]|nr:hypothetical protein [Eubacteriales bacterium]
MSEDKIKQMASYIYLKYELGKIAKEKDLTEKQVKLIESNLKSKLGITKDLCWL